MISYQLIHSKLRVCGKHLHSPLLLLIRLFWGASFFATGMGKFAHLDKVTIFFHSLGLPFPELNAILVASIETIGGACLFLGFASRLVCIPLICIMIAAFLTADSAAVRTIFSDPQNFIHRDPFSFLFASILVFVFGPGALSLDYWLWDRKCEPYTNRRK